MTDSVYDCLIIGGGPAGYTAALYAVRAGLRTILLEKFSAGGQMTQTQIIDNYPGFEEGIDGFTLGFKMQQSAERFGSKTIQCEVMGVDFSQIPKTVFTDSGEFKAKTVIVATGADHKHLGVANEEMLIGRGVGYCAACDGMFYKGKTVAVVGGGNSAVADALLLSKICKKVYLIHRRNTLRASKIYNEPLKNTKNIELVWNSRVTDFEFEQTITGVKVIGNDNTAKTLTVDGVFISIGRAPATEIFKGKLELDDFGYIIANESTKTSVSGVFAAGDVRTKPFRQIVTATADGAVAAYYAEEYLMNN